MSLSGHCWFIQIVFTLVERQECPLSNLPDRGMPVKMQSIRQMLKWLNSAAEPGTCFIEEFVNLLSPTVKPGSYLLLWSSHQHSAERICSPFPMKIKNSDKTQHRSPLWVTSTDVAQASRLLWGLQLPHRDVTGPKMGRRAPSLLINQVRQSGVVWILKLQMHRHQGDSHLLPLPVTLNIRSSVRVTELLCFLYFSWI